MKNAPNLYDTLTHIFGQHQHWLDKRHFQTLAWMIVGLLESGLIRLTAWTSEVDSRATLGQSTVRRFRRWLANERLQVNDLYGPIIQEALAEWGTNTLSLALDTSMLWDQYCLIRISVIYRGRAVPLVWDVITHGRSSVTFTTYRPWLDKALTLLPSRSQVIFLADRGFANTELMAYVSLTLLYIVLVDLTDAVAEALHLPFSAISIEMVYRSLYFFAQARQRGETDDVVAYLAHEAKFFGLLKRKRKDDNPSPLVFMPAVLNLAYSPARPPIGNRWLIEKTR